MARSDRTQDDLQQAIRGLNYEMDIMRRAGYALASRVYEGGSLQHITLLESFLLHVRNLLEFVVPPANVHGETIVAPDFFSSPDPWQGDCKKGQSTARKCFEEEIQKHPDWAECDLDHFRWRLHTKLAHISYSNTDLTKWPTLLIQSGVERAIARFVEQAREHGNSAPLRAKDE